MVESGYLCMRGGSIEAARNALEVTASEHALLMDVRVRAERGVACWVGPNAELGLSGVHIEESGTGVEALGSACMDGGCITDAETHAWVARGGEIVAHDVTARGTELTTAASVDGGTLRLRGCALLDNAGVGAVVGDGARAELVGVRFEGLGAMPGPPDERDLCALGLPRWVPSQLPGQAVVRHGHLQQLDRMPSIRRFRISEANIGPNRCHKNRTVSWLISTPRSCSRSSTFLSESGNLTYNMTASWITSRLVRK